MRKLTLIVIISLTLHSCFSSKIEVRNNVYRPEFDISNDNKNIICSFYENDKASIYQCDLTKKSKKKISPTSNYSYIRPVYSPDNSKYACLVNSSKDNFQNKLCIIDISNLATTELTPDSLLIEKYVFDKSGSYIYFSAAKHFENYSPIARKAAHGFDIYRITLADKKIEQITNRNSYSLDGLSITNNGDSLLFHITFEGMYFFNTKTKQLEKITANNDLRKEKKCSPYEYYAPLLSKDNTKITFGEPYEQYIMDIQTRTSKLIFRNEPTLVNVGHIEFFNESNYLLVSLPSQSLLKNATGNNYSFYTLDPETNALKQLDI